jgi:hypothetical protein
VDGITAACFDGFIERSWQKEVKPKAIDDFAGENSRRYNDSAQWFRNSCRRRCISHVTH